MVQKLRDLLRVGGSGRVDFWSLHEELIYIAKTYSTNNPPLLYLQTVEKRQLQIGEAYGCLAYLYTLGVPDPDGVLRFPHGWPRNVERALDAAVRGNRAGKCPLCYAVIGFATALGYPPLVDVSTAWASPSFFSTSGQSVAIVHDFSKGMEAPMPKLQSNSSSGPSQFLPPAFFAKEKRGFDVPFISYLLAHSAGDALGKLSVSYYLRNGLADPSGFYARVPYSSQSSIHRPPHNTASNCMASLPPLVEVASKAMNHDGGLIRYGYMHRNDKIKEHLTKDYAEFVVNLADEGAPEGMTALGELYYHGHEAGGIERNVERASQLWREAAGHGDNGAALAQAYVHLDGVQGEPQDAEPFLRQVVDTADGASAAFAEHYIYKLGLGTNKNATKAGELLKQAADQGDANAQLLLGHSYTGAGVGIEPPDGVNNSKALHYYKLAAKQERSAAAYNVGVLTLHGADVAIEDETMKCVEASGYFHKVAATHEKVSVLGAHAMWAWKKNDVVGAILGSMWLSELGINSGHVNAADLLKRHGAYISGIDNVLELLQKEQQMRDLENAQPDEVHSRMDAKCDVELLGRCSRDSSRVPSRAHGIFDEDGDFAMFPESKYRDIVISFEGEAHPTPSSIALSSATPGASEAASDLAVAQPSVSAPCHNSIVSGWTRKDITAAINHFRVAHFLRCWTRPEAFYSSITGAETMSTVREIGSVLPLELRETYFRTVAVAVGEDMKDVMGVDRNAEVRSLMDAYVEAMIDKIDTMPPQAAALVEVLASMRQEHSVTNARSKGHPMRDKEIIEKFLQGTSGRLCDSCGLYLIRRSAMQGDLSSIHDIIQRYLQADQGRAAYEWAAVAALMGDGRGLYEQANILQHGLGVLPNPSLSYQIYWQLAVHGSGAASVVYPDILTSPPPTTILPPTDSANSDSFVGRVALVRAAAAWLLRRMSSIWRLRGASICALLPTGVCGEKGRATRRQTEKNVFCEWTKKLIGTPLYLSVHSVRSDPGSMNEVFNKEALDMGYDMGILEDAHAPSAHEVPTDPDFFPLALRFWTVPYHGLHYSSRPLFNSSPSVPSSPSGYWSSCTVQIAGKQVGSRLLVIWLCSMVAVIILTLSAVVANWRARSALSPSVADGSAVVTLERSTKVSAVPDQKTVSPDEKEPGIFSEIEGINSGRTNDSAPNLVTDYASFHETWDACEEGHRGHQRESPSSSQYADVVPSPPACLAQIRETDILSQYRYGNNLQETHGAKNVESSTSSRSSHFPRCKNPTSSEDTDSGEMEIGG
eukprot:GHVS01074813.1.p1 GENE.GHVS01074813.1~~GHVS01074813.1.p1  ORF type:complete len:1479 (+),score=177.80 GHVS01074813.1:613-4437(+)